MSDFWFSAPLTSRRLDASTVTFSSGNIPPGTTLSVETVPDSSSRTVSATTSGESTLSVDSSLLHGDQVNLRWKVGGINLITLYSNGEAPFRWYSYSHNISLQLDNRVVVSKDLP